MTSCVHELVAEQAQRTPDATAVASGDSAVSYRELVRIAHRLAHRLRELGAGPETVVAVSLPRSVELVTSVLAVLVAGAAYLPLDPGEPARRRERIVADAGALVVITEEWLRDQDLTHLPVTPPEVDVVPGNLAYVIYTSGSTGTPKGVQVQHDTVVGYLLWCASAYEAGSGSGAPLHSPVAYDMSITTLFTPLVAGRAVVVLPESATALAPLAKAWPGNDFSFVKLTPSHLVALSQLLSPGSTATRRLVVGGEALTAEALRPWALNAPDTLVVNEYGPTETTVACCAHEFRAGAVTEGPVPIGTAIAGASLRVLDEKLQETDEGELYVGGAPVSRGYRGRPGTTATAFVPDPFSGVPGARLYRTGDLVRYVGGELVYLGRADPETKVRGYRVHPAEIEAVLCSHEHVDTAVVTAGPRLVAHVVGGPQVPLDEFLADRLPPHMIPAEIRWSSEMPLGPGGKVDRSRLPGAAGAHEVVLSDAGARTATEAVVMRVFGDLLSTPPFDPDADFFALGGHSMLAVRAVYLLIEITGLKLELESFYDLRTVEAIAAELDRLRETAAAEPVVHEGEL
ncbi:non-ribosomal peptide synthetase [Lentzea sp. CA-135723]|uniref:non-ribosomal peptide synthetase n=1 Tax=Lentzea sp. CA-135723 TaxID=3239950 RepID=UPI003D949416